MLGKCRRSAGNLQSNLQTETNKGRKSPAIQGGTKASFITDERARKALSSMTLKTLCWTRRSERHSLTITRWPSACGHRPTKDKWEPSWIAILAQQGRAALIISQRVILMQVLRAVLPLRAPSVRLSPRSSIKTPCSTWNRLVSKCIPSSRLRRQPLSTSCSI